MRRLVLGLLLVILLVSISQAQLLIGSRSSGMGGTGVASARDQSAAYYNPAALMKMGKAGFMASAGVSYSGIDKLMSAASSSTDPAKFAADNFGTKLDVDGNINGLIGGSFNKVGITVLPALTLNVFKDANSLVANGGAAAGYTGILTLGYSFGLIGISSVDVGANLKYLGGMLGTIIAGVNPVTGTAAGEERYGSQSGFGLDVGALLTFDIPAVTSLSVGIAARDLAETITSSLKKKDLTQAAGSNTYTEGPEQDLGSQSSTADSTYVLGVSGTIPVIGAVLAADLESGKNFSNTHFGLEYPLMANFLALRAGMASGNNLSLTTLGAKVGIPFFTLNLAYVINGKDSKASQIVLDLAGGF